MSSNVRILYEESVQGGRDEENSQYPNGVWVRVSHWESNLGFPNLPSFYVIESTVMVNREIVKEGISTYPNKRWGKSSEYIRMAIGLMDELKENIEGE